jgi:hypothetical protein
VADTALRNAIAADVFAIENAQGLAHESVVGSGAQPPPIRRLLRHHRRGPVGREIPAAPQLP